VLDTLARQPRRAEAPGPAADDRGMDARRADALADLVLGRATAAVDGPRLRVLVGAAAGAGREPDDPVELAGYGPLPPCLTRELALANSHRSVVTVSVGASPPTGGEDRYRPSAALDRYVRARDRHCQFPTCRQPAHRGDLDHIIAFPLGPTTAENQTARCADDTTGSNNTRAGGWPADPTAPRSGRRPLATSYPPDLTEVPRRSADA
jgi:hypothetical protein